MEHDVKKVQAVLSWLPGYVWAFGTLKTTGAAIPPTMHMNKEGETIVYVRPIFEDGATVGLFLKKSGIEAAVRAGKF